MAPRPVDIPGIVGEIEARRRRTPPDRSLLVGISGIDASGKGYVAARIADRLGGRGWRAANINIDGWLNLPSKRFSRDNPGKRFYENAIRFEAMFSRLILPLKKNRSIDLEADLVEETAAEYHRHRYRLFDLDIIVLEGIYLFRKDLRWHFDLAVWIDCPLETALERAIARGQEGLPPEATVNAYRKIYFPAQELHFRRDRPRDSADLTLDNS